MTQDQIDSYYRTGFNHVARSMERDACKAAGLKPTWANRRRVRKQLAPVVMEATRGLRGE